MSLNLSEIARNLKEATGVKHVEKRLQRNTSGSSGIIQASGERSMREAGGKAQVRKFEGIRNLLGIAHFAWQVWKETAIDRELKMVTEGHRGKLRGRR
jgi:hypothetical protein